MTVLIVLCMLLGIVCFAVVFMFLEAFFGFDVALGIMEGLVVAVLIALVQAGYRKWQEYVSQTEWRIASLEKKVEELSRKLPKE